MEKIISKEKFQELLNLVQSSELPEAEDHQDQINWLYDSTKTRITLDNLQLPSFLVISRACILYFANHKGTLQKLYQNYFDLAQENPKIKTDLEDIQRWVELPKISKSWANKLFLRKDNDISDMLKSERFDNHFGLPLPDPVTGRPKITDEKCKFNKCAYHSDEPNKETAKKTNGWSSWAKPPTSDALKAAAKIGSEKLVDHLKTNNCYVKGMHSAHEEVISAQRLTINKVNQEKMTVCPSPICNFPNFDSPEELTLHFMAFGIPPFWNSEMGERATLKYHDLLISKKITNYLFQPSKKNHCHSCGQQEPMLTISYPCMHQGICFYCLKKKNYPSVCPVCREHIFQYYPLPNLTAE